MLILFYIFTNDLNDRSEYFFSKFVGDTKMGTANTPKSGASIQKDLHKLEDRSTESCRERLRERGLFSPVEGLNKPTLKGRLRCNLNSSPQLLDRELKI